MRKGILASTIAVLLIAAGACAESGGEAAQEAPEAGDDTQESAESGLVRVVISTDFGDIEVDIDTENAPGTSANFLRYVDAGHYDGGQFHRTVTMDNQPDDTVRIEVIQASVNDEFAEEGFDAIPMERTSVTGLRHADGAISMARGPAGQRHLQLLLLHQRPAVARLRRQPQSRWPGIRGVWPGGERHGCGAHDPGTARRGADAEPAGADCLRAPRRLTGATPRRPAGSRPRSGSGPPAPPSGSGRTRRAPPPAG